MIKSCLFEKQKHYAPVVLAPSESALRHVPKSLRSRYLLRAKRAAQLPLSQITATDWSRFFQTGERALYESLYFSRRRRLCDLICGELLAPNLIPFPAILDTIWAICEESAWQLPAHNAYIRDADQLPWPDVSRPIVDLFAAETGALLSCAVQVLGERLPSMVRERIFHEVKTRILTPYLNSHFWWMDNKDGPLCNWTTWCTQNVLLCAFSLPFSNEERQKTIEKSVYSLDCFLNEYGEDGCCNEGAQYYEHAGLCLCGCLYILCQAAPGVFDKLWTASKIKNMAAYIFHMHIDGPYYVNFADCSPIAGRRSVRDYLFALRTQNSDMALFAAKDWLEAQGAPDENADIARINLWYQLLELQYAADMESLAHKAPAVKASDACYNSVGVYISRHGEWFLAAKAGCNADSHNHNDTGSILLYHRGQPFLIDLGVETYTQKTFSPQRYEIWTMQSAWHNLPTFDHVMQKAGEKYCARQVDTLFSSDKFQMSMELSAAWPKEAKLSAYYRTIVLSEDGLLLKDLCKGDYKSAYLSLLLKEKPLVKDNAVLVGSLGKISIQGATGSIETDTIPITDTRLRIAWPDTLYRLRIPFQNELNVEVKA